MLSPKKNAECAEGFGNVDLLAVLDYRGSISLPLFRPLAPINATISLAPQPRSCRVAPGAMSLLVETTADNGGDRRKEPQRLCCARDEQWQRNEKSMTEWAIVWWPQAHRGDNGW
mmetsp:Transcript_30522/g.49884  ORF Transcript_30522/g.49884 Transcript_30522/m.49884 type:complete len:115 (-) Transcript_30522:12-356(-)